MPNRILREGILTSPRIARLGWAEEVFYRRLMSVVDDFGRYYGDQGMLRAACYPRQLSKVSDSDIGKWLTALVEAALVSLYRAEDREWYIELLDFRQQVRAKESRFPHRQSGCAADAKQTPSTGEASAHLDVFVDVDVSPRKRGGSVHDFPPGFEALWAEYPRKVGKGDAAKAFAKLKPDADLQSTMLAAVKRQRESEQWKRDGGQFVPHMATWINGRRWLDEGCEPGESGGRFYREL